MLKNFTNSVSFLYHLRPLLPAGAWQAIADSPAEWLPLVEEVILRAGRPMSLTVASDNRLLPFYATEEELCDTLLAACGGSLYAYRDTLSEGYLPLSGGIRLGVGGRAVIENGRPNGVKNVQTLLFRLPHRVRDVGAEACAYWRAEGCESMLICGAPASGKTTLLRDMAIHLSSGDRPLRVVAIDTRGELFPTEEGDLLCPLTGYPRDAGLEIALRTLSPELLVLDEISAREADAVHAAARAGVPLLASLHARTKNDLRTSPAGKALVLSGAFPLVCMILERGKFEFFRAKEVL